MSTIDFDYLYIHTQSGWREGISQSLSVDEKGRLILASKETISLGDITIQSNESDMVVNNIEWQSIGFDKHNHLYLLATTGQLYRYLKQQKELQPLPLISVNAAEKSNTQFDQIAFSKSIVYLLNIEKAEIQAYFFPSLQFQNRLTSDLEKPIAIETDHLGNLYILDVSKPGILIFNANGNCVQKINFDIDSCTKPIQQPVSFALGKTPVNCLFVLDAASCSIFKFDLENKVWTSFVSLLSINPLLNPQTIVLDKDGIISIAGKSKQIYQFDAEGRYIAKLDIDDECLRLTHDKYGELYGLCAEEKQIFHFGSKTEFSSAGSYVSKVLDSQQFQCHWHRIALDIEQPEKTRFVVHYVASDTVINADQIMPDQWNSFINSSSHAINDALFESAIGQYLILKFEFFGDGLSSPTINSVRIYFQRDSYLRYLPATYQEDVRGKDFLERFLSLYESMSLEIDEKISTLPHYFDADVQEEGFLEWISSWLDIIVDENWSKPKQRTLLKESFELYKYRGTQKTLRRIIEIFIDSKVTIIEHWNLHPPMILNQAIVGVNSFVGAKRTQRLIVEESSRIGEFTLDEQEDSPEAPFAKNAYDFTILADTSLLTGTHYLKTLNRLIEAEKPAHTRYFLRTTTGTSDAALGTHSLLGIDTVLGKGQQPMRIGKNARIGKETLVGNRYRIKGRLNTKAQVDIDAIIL